MSKGYASALALIEAGKQMALGAKKEPMRTERKKEPDILAMLEAKRREYEQFKLFVEQQGKLNKPDEKKKEPKISERDVLLLLMALSPIIGAVALHILRL